MLTILLFIVLIIIGFVTACFVRNEFVAVTSFTISIMLGCFLVLMIAGAIIEHTPSGVSDKKIELNTKYEWLTKNKDNPYFVNDIIEYNCDVKQRQRQSQSLWFNCFVNPAYQEAKIIDLD